MSRALRRSLEQRAVTEAATTDPDVLRQFTNSARRRHAELHLTLQLTVELTVQLTLGYSELEPAKPRRLSSRGASILYGIVAFVYVRSIRTR